MRAEFIPPPRFRLLRRLGEGATGIVYEAVDKERGVRVALKTLDGCSASGRARVEREFQSLRAIEHKNLVRLEELFAENEPAFFTMELVEGVDFLAYVRDPSSASPNGCNEARLRGALLQLTRALVALHEARKIHRDVKPANIRVTGEGRLVLLDFGLVTDAEQHRRVTEPKVVGTVEYMAPEQASVGEVGPAADWYGAGCLLYEALTGRLPFTGTSIDIMLNKQRDDAPSPRALAPSVAADLDALCSSLLSFDPSSRPAGRQVLQRLQGASTSSQGETASASGGGPFVGRAKELDALRAAFETTRQGTAVTLLVEGDSGVGKTALVRRAIDVLSADARLVVLEGHCRERQSVPYKALDGIIDGLARVLSSLPASEVAAILPTQSGLLAHMFPALKRVDAIASKAVRARGVLDPLEERSRVFAECRDLFTRLATRHAVVLVVDDLQWADADSLALLGEIMRPPEGPSILLLATTRAVGAAHGIRGAHGAEDDLRRVHVTRLPDADAVELAGILMERAHTRTLDVTAIAREAGGHPLFIDELVRHAAALGAVAREGPLRLDDALWDRVQRLDEVPRRLVELIAVAGMPLGTQTLARAAGIEPEATQAFLAYLSLLRAENLVRATGDRRTDVAEPYHDRVREAVLGHLDPAKKRALHESIALALKAEAVPDHEALFTHWLAAGDDERAAAHAEKAGAVAEAALAFDHAARLFREALALHSREGREAPRALRRRLADALANAGAGFDAAREYVVAASDASPAEAFDLRQRAAQQFLLAGFIDEGLETSRALLATVGMTLPRTPLQAILSYLFRRFLIRLRGLGFVERHETEASQRELIVVDLCWSLSFSLSVVDTVRGADFQARCLLLSLRLGEPYRVARALAMEASLGAAMGDPWERTQAKATRAVAIATRVGSSRAIALATGMAGTAAYLAGHYKLARAQLDDALRQFREVTAVWSEIARARYFVTLTLGYLGDIVEMGNRLPVYVREAEELGDRYAATSCRTGQAILVWLARDNPRGAREDVADAMGSWSKDGFQVPHWQALVAHGDIELYEGDAGAARQRVLREWAPLERSLLLRIQVIRTHASYLRGRSALAVAATDPGRRRSLLREAASYARRCIEERSPFGLPVGSVLLGSCASLVGDVEGSLAHLERAIDGFDRADMALHAAVCRYAAAEIRGGSDSETARDDAARWMQSQGIRAPAKFVRMLAPGFVRAG